MRSRDHAEAWLNAVVGLGISTALVWLLRAAGFWDAPALAVSSVFFAASVGRSYALRRVFRRGEDGV
jgi:hypothetical protein